MGDFLEQWDILLYMYLLCYSQTEFIFFWDMIKYKDLEDILCDIYRVISVMLS